jgi:glycolate oxidase
VKGVAGYDLTGLFVGSEGTLGVIVGATLRLRPLPATTTTIAAAFPDVATAARAAVAVTAAGVRPALAELLDAATLGAVAALRGRSDRSGRSGPASPGRPGPGALLIVQTDGAAHALEADIVTEALAPLASSLRRAADPAEAADLLADRRLALPALERLGRPLIEDIAVPRSRLAEAIEEIAAIGAATGARIFTFAHAADGNIHPIIVLDDGDGDGADADPAGRAAGSAASASAPRTAEDAAEKIFSLALRLGGTVTGEHGVGVLKRRWLAAELGERSLDLQHRLKTVLDPHGMLNPGKAI